MKHEASLTDIEDDNEYEWLKERIAESYARERISVKDAVYFVDIHRYLYNTDAWTWGGPSKNRSFIQYLDKHVSHDLCEEKLCAGIQYDAGLKWIGLGKMYCGIATWNSRAICKKHVIAPKTMCAYLYLYSYLYFHRRFSTRQSL